MATFVPDYRSARAKGSVAQKLPEDAAAMQDRLVFSRLSCVYGLGGLIPEAEHQCIVVRLLTSPSSQHHLIFPCQFTHPCPVEHGLESGVILSVYGIKHDYVHPVFVMEHPAV